MNNIYKTKDKLFFSIIIGSLYILFGLVQLLAGFGYSSEWMTMTFIPADLIGGCILVLIGAIFLYGVKELHSGLREGVAYVYVGILLSLGFFIIYLLVMGANALSAYGPGSEDFIGWSPLDDMKPGIYLGLLSLVAFFVWRKKFTVTGITKAGT
ncbi:MAG: hypothetical protein JW771_02940 [Candidatus Thermoplasmatota archaeon]|nr:hypothetical protein [Candidatus Thermoplasmatota archaeon]